MERELIPIRADFVPKQARISKTQAQLEQERIYRSRPDGDNPDSGIYDIWALLRFSPGAQPVLRREFYHGNDDWRVEEHFGLILIQDFQNMYHVHKGMKSRGFSGSRTNPKQELPVSSFHRVTFDYINGKAWSL